MNIYLNQAINIQSNFYLRRRRSSIGLVGNSLHPAVFLSSCHSVTVSNRKMQINTNIWSDSILENLHGYLPRQYIRVHCLQWCTLYSTHCTPDTQFTQSLDKLGKRLDTGSGICILNCSQLDI